MLTKVEQIIAKEIDDAVENAVENERLKANKRVTDERRKADKRVADERRKADKRIADELKKADRRIADELQKADKRVDGILTEAAINMFKAGDDIEKISKCLSLPYERLEELRASIYQGNK